MPKLKPETQAARRAAILDAAEYCFAHAGFHATSIQDICRAAGVSAGGLYVYFPSKEALIEGLCERNRGEFAERFAELDQADDFMAALSHLADTYLNEPKEKRAICIEIGAEATRNPGIAKMYLAVDKHVEASFRSLFEHLIEQGRIAPEIAIDDLMRIMMLISDGLFWRQTIDPDFDTPANTKAALNLIGALIKPVAQEGARSAPPVIGANAAGMVKGRRT
jgi:TetR/AcrR family transcriptional regulator, repressor for uid operon